MALSQFDTGEHPLKRPVTDLVWHKYLNTPRNLQKELGPSEIGDPCDRRLAYNLMHQAPVNMGSDPLPSIVGTASHAWLDDACRLWNEHVGEEVWIPECKVTIDANIHGHSDAYYVPLNMVVDWKFLGTDSLRKIKKNGPTSVYHKQIHLYGKGYKRLGFTVKSVALVCFSRGGLLSGTHYWSEPYNEAVADAALKRYWDLTELCVALEVDKYPDRYDLLSTEPSHACNYCQWFLPSVRRNRDPSLIGCEGYLKDGKR